MTRVAEHSFAALQQNGLIEGGKSGESRVHWQRPKCRTDVIEPRALNQSKARVSGRKPAEQRHKSRTEEQ